MLTLTIILLGAVTVLGAMFAGRRRGARRRLYVVSDSSPRKKPRLRVWRGKLDRKNLYYDPKQFRRRRR